MEFLQIQKVETLTIVLCAVGASLCLLSYGSRLLAHLLAYRRGRDSSLSFGFAMATTFAGYLGWGYWSAADPVKMNISRTAAIAVGIPLAALGLGLFLYSELSKHGVGQKGGLITTGIYAKIRHPMYIGLVLLHAGYPLIYRSFAAWASTLLWAAFILVWTQFEEANLERAYGEEYRRYREKTWF